MEAVAKALVRLFGVEPKDEITSAFTVEEVEHILAESRHEGLLEDGQHGLVGAALEFSDKDAVDVAVPLSELVTLPSTATPDDVERLVAKHGFSRYPLVDRRGRPRRLPAPQGRALRRRGRARHRRCRSSGSASWRPCRPPTRSRTVLATMQRTGPHLARVVDPDGTDIGVVFLEDVIEELVGEVTDASQR